MRCLARIFINAQQSNATTVFALKVSVTARSIQQHWINTKNNILPDQEYQQSVDISVVSHSLLDYYLWSNSGDHEMNPSSAWISGLDLQKVAEDSAVLPPAVRDHHSPAARSRLMEPTLVFEHTMTYFIVATCYIRTRVIQSNTDVILTQFNGRTCCWWMIIPLFYIPASTSATRTYLLVRSRINYTANTSTSRSQLTILQHTSCTMLTFVSWTTVPTSFSCWLYRCLHRQA